MLQDINFPYKVDIPFRKGDTISDWDIICADCIETYGLPGDKYVTSVTKDNMVFYFQEEKDALWFSLSAK